MFRAVLAGNLSSSRVDTTHLFPQDVLKIEARPGNMSADKIEPRHVSDPQRGQYGSTGVSSLHIEVGQTPPYKWWNWHDNYDAEPTPHPKWVDILTDPQGAAARRRDEDREGN